MGDPLDIEDRIVAAIRRIVRAIDLHSQRLRERSGITAPQLAALREIDRHGEINVGSLARAIHLSQPTVSGILDRLERQGLVRRTWSERDRRAVLVTLTESGAATLRNAPSLLKDRFRRYLGDLDEWEQLWILSALQRIAVMMDAEDIDAAPLLETGPMVPSRPDAAPAALEAKASEDPVPEPTRRRKSR